MSGNIFPVKLMSILIALYKSGAIQEMAKGAPVNAPQDGMTRLMLCTPEVHKVVTAKLGRRDYRVRLAVPDESQTSDFSCTRNVAVEFYSREGGLLQEPLVLTQVEDDLANAIQVELFHAILRAKGCPIPTM